MQRLGAKTVNSLTFGWFEIAIGIAGIVLGSIGKMSRASVIISVGLIMFGVSHMVSHRLLGIFNDGGALIVLFGIGMSISLMRRQRRGPKPPR